MLTPPFSKMPGLAFLIAFLTDLAFAAGFLDGDFFPFGGVFLALCGAQGCGAGAGRGRGRGGEGQG